MPRARRLFYYPALFAVLCVSLFQTSAMAEKNQTKQIFFLHSYVKGHAGGQPQADGVMAALKKAGFLENKNLRTDFYHMDALQTNTTPSLINKQAEIALLKIRKSNPDLLIVIDDDAFRTVALALVDSIIPIVFTGMNNRPENYHKTRRCIESRDNPGHNITGVYEHLHIADAFTVHHKIFNNVNKIRIFVDASPIGDAILEQIKLELSKQTVPCQWDIEVTETWEAYKTGLTKANKAPDIGAIYPAALLLEDKDGNRYTAPEIFHWTVNHSIKPEIAQNAAFTRMGLFGGAAVNTYAMGFQAGEMAARILTGTDPGTIPIENAEHYALVFNLERANQLSIKIPPHILADADEVITGQ